MYRTQAGDPPGVVNLAPAKGLISDASDWSAQTQRPIIWQVTERQTPEASLCLTLQGEVGIGADGWE